jgi:hypothetical protein
MPREIAAGYIEAFVHGTLRDPYSWDDFETIPHENPEVDLALNLCWWAAKNNPARHDKEYMAPSGAPYFLKIAALLRTGALEPFVNHKRDEILKGNIPKELLTLLME